jgi:hypothetical protein
MFEPDVRRCRAFEAGDNPHRGLNVVGEILRRQHPLEPLSACAGSRRYAAITIAESLSDQIKYDHEAKHGPIDVTSFSDIYPDFIRFRASSDILLMFG